MADRQPVDIGKPCRRDRQRRPWADDHPSLACIDAHHIKRFRLTADVDSATLAHREVDEPAMAAKHPPLQVDDLAGVIGFRTELPDNGRIIAARYEADILAVGLGSHAQAMLLRQRSHLARSQEHTSALQSLMRISYAVFR